MFLLNEKLGVFINMLSCPPTYAMVFWVQFLFISACWEFLVMFLVMLEPFV